LCFVFVSIALRDKVKDVQLRFLVSSFIVLKRNLYSKKVLLSKYKILNNLKLDILVIERFVKSLRFAKLASIIVIISAI
jgi:hypothetical protein